MGIGFMSTKENQDKSIGLDRMGDGVKYPKRRLRSGSIQTKQFVWSLKYENIQMQCTQKACIIQSIFQSPQIY